MNPKALIALILSIILWVALVVALATPWFWTKDGEGDDYEISYYKYDSVRTVEYEDGVKDGESNRKYSNTLKRYYKEQIKIFSASLALAVLAFVIVTVFVFLVVLQLLNVKLPGAIIGRFIPFISLFFCLLSMFVFLGSTNARNKDCLRYNDPDECESDLYHSFMGSEEDFSWGGGVGFVFIILSSIINLATAIFVFFIGLFNSDAQAQAQ